MADPFVLNALPVAIAAGASESAQIDIGGWTAVGLVVPSNWTTAGISLQASPDGGTTWCELVDQTASPVGSASLTGGTSSWFVAVDPTILRGVRSLKVRSGTLALPVLQVDAVTLTLLTRFVS